MRGKVTMTTTLRLEPSIKMRALCVYDGCIMIILLSASVISDYVTQPQASGANRHGNKLRSF